MTKFDEMCDAAAAGIKARHDYRERCWKNLALLFNGFLSYAQIPPENVTFLRWNGLVGEGAAYERAGEGRLFTITGAAVQDADGFWNVGIRIDLSPGAFIFLCIICGRAR